jgi:hypothetical protein
MWRLAPVLLLGLGLVAGCAANRPPEETTDDGLVRVPSRSVGGVYRDPESSFTQYRRIMLEPPSIGLKKGWRDEHPDITQEDLARILTDAMQLFREEFAREFVRRGTYRFADEPAPDVVLVVPNIEDLDIPAPEAGTRMYSNGAISMKITGDLRDASTNKLIGRVILIQPDEPFTYKARSTTNRVTNAHEQRLVYANWTRLVREALDVAKAARPRPKKPAGTDEAHP